MFTLIGCSSVKTTCFLLLTVRPPAVVITPSLTTTVDQGDQVTFSCSATGLAADTFVYGWLLNRVTVKGETGQILDVTTSSDAVGNYQCTVRNVYGRLGKSKVATLILSKIVANRLGHMFKTMCIYS